MGIKKGKPHFGEAIIEDVLKMSSEGKTHREISEFYGFENKKVIEKLLYRHRRKERLLKAGVQLHKKGRPRKNSIQTSSDKDNEIKQLKMENELLRSFLYEAERWNVKG